MKDWDSHTLTARVIAVSTQLIALWEAFLLLAGTGWGGGLMLILLASAKLFFLVRPWLHGVWCGAVSLNVHDMLRRLPFERPFDISQLLASNWPTWMRYLTTLILSARENENQPHGDSESEWSEVMPPRVPWTPVRNRNRDISPMSSTPGRHPSRHPRTLD